VGVFVHALSLSLSLPAAAARYAIFAGMAKFGNPFEVLNWIFPAFYSLFNKHRPGINSF